MSIRLVNATWSMFNAAGQCFYHGELVYLFCPNADHNSPNTIKKRSYIGPYCFIRQENAMNFPITDAVKPGAKPQKVNSHRLITYVERKAELDYLTKIVFESKQYTHPPQLIK